MMDKYLIVTDTTSAIDKLAADKYGIELVSLSVIINGNEYKDQIDMTTEELYEKLNEGHVPSTSQPNQGYIQDLMTKWKEANYEAIIIITCSKDLSGTWSAFNLAKESTGLDNVYIVDSRQVGSPIMDMVFRAKDLAEQGVSVEDIIGAINKKSDNSFSFLYPENFSQLKKSGRLSPAAVGIATMFKIKALLYLKEDGSCVEKFAMSRTESKILGSVIEKFKSLGVNAKEHVIYLAHANNLERANRIKEILGNHFENMEFVISSLPAVLTCHGGLGCVAIHSTYKV